MIEIIEPIEKGESKENSGSYEELETMREKIQQKFDTINNLLNGNESSIQIFLEKINDYLTKNYKGFKIVKDNKGHLSLEYQEIQSTKKQLEILMDSIKTNQGIYIDTNNDGVKNDTDIDLITNIIEEEGVQDKIKNIEAIRASAGELLSKEKEQPGYLMNEFMIQDEKNLNEYSIDFKGNLNAEINIGLDNLIPKGVTKISIITDDGKVVGTRKGINGGFFNQEGIYIPIFSGDKIIIEEKITDEEIKKIEDEKQKQYNIKLNEKNIKELYTIQGVENEKIKERIGRAIEKSIEYNVDPNQVIAMWKTENEKMSENMGIDNISMNTFEGQLVLLCRRLQTIKEDYEKKTGKKADGGEVLNPEFTSYSAGIINTNNAKNDPENYFLKLIKNICNAIGKIFGIQFFKDAQENMDEGLQKDIKYNEYSNSNYKNVKRGNGFQEGISVEGFNIIGDEKTVEKVKDFDYNAYKEGIALLESNGNYKARNDSSGKKRGVKPDSWAFGRYQFITSTLRGFGVDLKTGNGIDENKVQDRLNNKEKQEEIMKKFTEHNAKVILKKYPNVIKNDKDLAVLLSIAHHSGLGGVGNYIKTGTLGKDWLGGSTSSYMKKTAGLYENYKKENGTQKA